MAVVPSRHRGRRATVLDERLLTRLETLADHILELADEAEDPEPEDQQEWPLTDQ